MREKLLTPEQAAQMPTADHLKWLTCVTDETDGHALLRSRRITPEQVALLPTADHVRFLATEEGRNALISGSLTIEKVMQTPNAQDLSRNAPRSGGCVIS